jgi:hypothetical protein
LQKIHPRALTFRARAHFAESQAVWSLNKAAELVAGVFSESDIMANEAQQFAILGSPEAGIHALYSVGFIGIQDKLSGRYRFCHDGNQTKTELAPDAVCLIHPCYWRALNVKSADLSSDVAEEMPSAATEIQDEYDVEISSKTPEIRKHRIGQIIATLQKIPKGQDGAGLFEDWCQQAISILFAAGLRNIELKPNGSATQRRDLVARNNGSTDTWRRILDDYRVRQVMFEIKNYEQLGPTEYRQIKSYLVRDYGSLAFVITREEDESLRKDKDLAWVREIYFEHRKLIVKLTGRWLANYLSKARNPQKHDAADLALGGLLDRYVRNYLSLRR